MITREDIEAVFGTKAVRTWANIDQTNTSTTEATITARIATAIEHAEQYLNDYLYGSRYEPITEADASTKTLLAKIAGEYLYGMRGLRETAVDNAMATMMNEVRSELKKIVSGVRRKDWTLSHDDATIPVILE